MLKESPQSQYTSKIEFILLLDELLYCKSFSGKKLRIQMSTAEQEVICS